MPTPHRINVFDQFGNPW